MKEQTPEFKKYPSRYCLKCLKTFNECRCLENALKQVKILNPKKQ